MSSGQPDEIPQISFDNLITICICAVKREPSTLDMGNSIHGVTAIVIFLQGMIVFSSSSEMDHKLDADFSTWGILPRARGCIIPLKLQKSLRYSFQVHLDVLLGQQWMYPK